MPYLRMANQPIISVDNLVKSYGSFKAVKGISFEVFEGENIRTARSEWGR
jgi:ABC-type phosphonate transport system ATPase subunit